MKKNEKQEVKEKVKEKEKKTSDNTVMYKPIQSKKSKKPKEKKKHPKLKKFIKVVLVMCILLAVSVGGVLAAIVYRCIWGDWALDEKKLDITYENSKMYDKDGNVVATLRGNENRDIISKDEMSEYLPKAFISIEDERFEEHNRS